MAKDTYTDGLKLPLSFGEKQAVAELRKIDATKPAEFENRQEHVRLAKLKVGNSPRPR